MHHTITAVVLLIAIIIAPTAKAQDVDIGSNGFTNLEYCKRSHANLTKPPAVYETGYHDGYCNGVTSGTLIALTLSGAICVPRGVTNGQALRVVVTYMEHVLAELAGDALHEAFACHGSGGTPTR
jgi:Rap1a immunity proteins